MITSHIGDCRNEQLIEDIFGSVSEFARICEEFGDDGFMYGDGLLTFIEVVYDSDADIHYFYQISD